VVVVIVIVLQRTDDQYDDRGDRDTRVFCGSREPLT